MHSFISKLYFWMNPYEKLSWFLKKKIVFAQLFFWQTKIEKKKFKCVYYQNMLPYPLLHEPLHPTHGNSSLLNVDSMKLQFLFLVFFHWLGKFCQVTLVYHILFFLKSAGIKFRLFLIWSRVGFQRQAMQKGRIFIGAITLLAPLKPVCCKKQQK